MASYSLKRGDTFKVRFPVKGLNLETKKFEALNLTGARLWFTIKSAKTDPDPGVLQKDSEVSGWTIDDAVNGIATLSIPPAETEVLSPGEYYFDAQVLTAAGEVFTFDDGIVQVKADVTLSRS